MELVVATSNRKKLKEIEEIWSGLGLEITSLADHPGMPKIIENGRTFKENAAKKAVKIAKATGKLTMGEDSGLCVDALDGGPGIYSARFAGKAKDDRKNNRKLLRLLGNLPLKKRRAEYVSAVALADDKGLVGVVEGKCPGLIGFEEMGHSGFGYDPLFIIPKYGRTFAELGEAVKHTISHRFRALKKARLLLEKYIEHYSSH